MTGIFIRTVPSVIQAFGCTPDAAQRYCDLREEGYGGEQAKLMAGLSDPPEDEDLEEGDVCGGCNPEPTISELEDGRCDSCGKALS